jgi:hypothetical protein
MPDDRADLVPFLNKLALFRELTPSQLEGILDQFERVQLRQGEELFSQGDPGDSMYIVLSGKISITRGRKERLRELANMVRGDIFGEEALLYHQRRSATATTLEPSELLRLSDAKLSNVLRTYPQLKPFLETIVHSRRLARQQHYNWLGQNETIYLVARKHVTFLFVSLVAPLLFSWLALIFFGLAVWIGESTTFSLMINVIGLIILAVAVLWGIWIWIDWGNDFYIVSNQRVVWIEKVVFLYDSRKEAPLSTVLTIGTSTDYAGRLLGYGKINVRTYTGQIVMEGVGHPEQLASFIMELQDRARAQVKQAETAALEQEIRKRLNLPDSGTPKKDASPSQEPKEQPVPLKARRKRPAPRPGIIRQWLMNIFKVRYEQKGIVTYRKHWVLLVGNSLKPILALLALLVVIWLRSSGIIQFPSVPVLLVLSLLSLFGIFLWWLYIYVDWRNDIYQLTQDQIIDIYRKPLGSEDRKSANIENILSLQHERRGILGLIFNYGNVTAVVGPTRFTFEGVYNPAGVEQDIFERINIRKGQQKEVEDQRERERVADWMAAYHRQIEALRRGENHTKTDRNSG